jgi:hypothetical protein
MVLAAWLVLAGQDSLIEKLGDDSYAVREEAQRELTAMGDAALPALRHHRDRTRDPEVRARLVEIIQAIAALEFQTDLATARRRAREAGRLMLVFVGPLPDLQDDALRDLVRSKFILLQRPADAPTTYVATSGGKVLHVLSGDWPLKPYRQELFFALMLGPMSREEVEQALVDRAGVVENEDLAAHIRAASSMVHRDVETLLQRRMPRRG